MSPSGSPALMRVECPACERLAPPASFRLEGARLFLTCARCGAEHLALESTAQRAGAAVAVAAAAPSPSAPPGPARVSAVAPAAPALRVVSGQGGAAADEEALFSVPEGHCPKCVGPRRPEALACAACGLVFTNYVPGQQAPLPPAITVGWRLLQERWEERAAHDALLAQAQASGHLAPVGRLYRIRLARQPGDAQARRALEEVVRLALLPSERTEERSEAEAGIEKAPRWVRSLLYVLLFLFLVGFVLALGARLLSGSEPPLP